MTLSVDNASPVPTDATARDELTVPASEALRLVEVARRCGVTARELLSGFDLAEASLKAPGSVVPAFTYACLLERARELTGEPGLGLLLGLATRASEHGFLGFAMMTAPTLRQAIELAIQFAPARSSVLSFQLEDDGRRAALTIEERVSLGSIRDIVLFASTGGIRTVANAITGRDLVGEAEFAFPEPEYYGRWRALAPGRVRFDRPHNRLLFDAGLLDTPLVMADPTAMGLAREQCERELAVVGKQRPFLTQCRAVLFAGQHDRVPTLPELARKLALSTRTLKRRLQAHGTSYSELVRERRLHRATELLRSHMTVEQIADRLGYSDPANFTRAFRRWTGQSPRAFRRWERDARRRRELIAVVRPQNNTIE